MLPPLQSSLEQIETKKSEIERIAKEADEKQISHTSTSKQWSVAQHVDHLVIFEESILAGHNNLLISGKTIKPKFKGRAFVSIIGGLVRAKFRFGTTTDLEPLPNIDIEKRLKDWSEVRERLIEEMEKLTEKDLNEPFTLHPIAGALTVQSTISLIGNHTDYHLHNMPKL